MTASRFLELVRAMGGDVYTNTDGDIVLDTPPLLVDAVRWRVDEIGTRELAQELQDELERAGARVRARGIEVQMDEHHPVGMR